ncbi:MAG: AAA family ATPase [Bacteroidetes bacterium]|nr:AAA family ATPase [Bacteroidota bacterium]
MKKELIGRKKEVKDLEAALQSNRPEFVAIVGRRRVGKTFLIKETYGSFIDFELTGLQHAKKSDQLQNFIFALKSQLPDFQIKKKPKSWLEAFFLLSNALEEKGKQEKLVVFLDELPWMGTKRSGFITGLGWFWNSWATNQNIVVVICGSSASWMIEKIINDRGGLHNRVTKLFSLYPFTLRETESFLKSRNIHLGRYQIVQLYLSMGGIPMYLDQVKPGLSAVQNIQAIFFQKSGYLRNEFDRLFASLFDNFENHVEVIKALASKRQGMTRQEIIDNCRFQNGGMLSEILSELQQSGFIGIYQGYGKKTRMSIYRLIDPYSLFYLTFIQHLGVNSKTDFTKLSDLPKYKSWSGYAFENICLTHIDQIRKALGISGIYTSISTFVARASEDMPGAQIDLIIDRSDQSINICEIKFSSSDYEVSKKDIDNIENKKRVFRHHTQTKKHLFTSLITTFGVVENKQKLNHIDQVVLMDDLFE